MPLVVKERARLGPVLVLELKGKLTWTQGSERLDAELQRLINAGDQQLLLDCAGVSTIDSQGIKALVRGVVSARNRQGAVKLLRLTPRVRESLGVTHLLTVIECFDDEAAALQSYAALAGET